MVLVTFLVLFSLILTKKSCNGKTTTDVASILCEEKDDFDEKMCSWLTFHCQNGRSKRLTSYKKGTNNTEELFCPPLRSRGLDVVCVSYRYGYVPCDGRIPIGTVAKWECQEHYVSVDDYIKSNKTIAIRCQDDGKWSGRVLRCKPDCGRITLKAEPLIINGEEETNWPWHGVVYIRQKGEWIASCGSTLISEKAVLTAAHCVWKKAIQHLLFAFAKYKADFHSVEDFTQVAKAKRIYTRPEYLDYRSNYGSDIAVAILEKRIALSEYIKPACLDWDMINFKYHLRADQTGTVAGMGLTADGTPSATLQSLKIPVVSPKICISNQDRDFKKYVTYTTFCAGWINGTGVCNGDSGGGLLFRDVQNSNRWILQGIVSVSPRRRGKSVCDPTKYAIFTKVGLYLDWLKDILGNSIYA